VKILSGDGAEDDFRPELCDKTVLMAVRVPIYNVEDDRVAIFRNVKDAQCRAQGLFIVESERVLERSAELGLDCIGVLVSERRSERLDDVLTELGCSVYVASAELVNAIVGFPLHRGVLAIARRSALPSPSAVLQNAQRIVVLENVVDPDNIGSVFRHCAAFGADAVILSEHCGDPLYRKAVRSSMGWVFDVPWTRIDDRHGLVPELRRAGFTSLALTPSGATDIRHCASQIGSSKLALLFGSESEGLAAATMDASDLKVRVPISAHVDSLNVATTAALAMYELFRQPVKE
jgi:tRNA G18 (ribose-2'-O)-methylase SpoU